METCYTCGRDVQLQAGTLQGDKLQVGFFIEQEGAILPESFVRDFSSFHSLQCFVEIYLPWKYRNLTQAIVCPLHVPARIKAELERNKWAALEPRRVVYDQANKGIN